METPTQGIFPKYSCQKTPGGALANIVDEDLEVIVTEGILRTSDVSAGGVDYFDNSDPDYTVRWTIVDNVSPADTKTITVRVTAVRQVVGDRKGVTLTTLRGI